MRRRPFAIRLAEEGFRLRASGFRLESEARSPKPEVRSPKPEARSPKPEFESESGRRIFLAIHVTEVSVGIDPIAHSLF
jgi:hypothetical protein